MDPDDYRDSAICDGIPRAHWAAGHGLTMPQHSAAEARVVRLRERLRHLREVLAMVRPAMPDVAGPSPELVGDADELASRCAHIEHRIAEMLGKI